MVYFHKRDDKGMLVAPPGTTDKNKLKMPKTLAQELAGVEGLKGLLTQVDFEKMVEEIKSRWSVVDGEEVRRAAS